MKKALLVCSIILSSAFFASAQFQSSHSNGVITGEVGGLLVQVDPFGEGLPSNERDVTIYDNQVPAYTTQGSGVNLSAPMQLLSLAQLFVARSVPLLVGMAVLVFFFFLVQFIWKGSTDPAAQEKGKKGMLYSILAIFVMVSVWGIIAMMGSILGIGQGGTINGFNLPG